uniref:Uncharacterized protein n=1 Tax=viral metagenome TaxID=1070528 RepID=A0A6C0DRN6_9ZZZZ
MDFITGDSANTKIYDIQFLKKTEGDVVKYAYYGDSNGTAPENKDLPVLLTVNNDGSITKSDDRDTINKAMAAIASPPAPVEEEPVSPTVASPPAPVEEEPVSPTVAATPATPAEEESPVTSADSPPPPPPTPAEENAAPVPVSQTTADLPPKPPKPVIKTTVEKKNEDQDAPVEEEPVDSSDVHLEEVPAATPDAAATPAPAEEYSDITSDKSRAYKDAALAALKERIAKSNKEKMPGGAIRKNTKKQRKQLKNKTKRVRFTRRQVAKKHRTTKKK